MQFDSEGQRTLTLELIEKAPIQGNTSTVLPVIEQLLQLKQAALSATISGQQGQEAKPPTTRKRTLREVEKTDAPKTTLTPAEEAGVEQITTTPESAPPLTGGEPEQPAAPQKRSWPARKPRGTA